MAMMEHACPNCNWATFNNSPTSPARCPKCGAELGHFADEDPDYPEPEDDYDDEA